MGWSCNRDAGLTMDAWTAICIAQTNTQNTYEVDGRKYFWDISRREHADGAITGLAFVMVGENGCFDAGSFRIEGDGSVKRWPCRFQKVYRAFVDKVNANRPVGNKLPRL